nr:MAG TPA: hypothetical protein [Caudoviricetes sp.]
MEFSCFRMASDKVSKGLFLTASILFALSAILRLIQRKVE